MKKLILILLPLLLLGGGAGAYFAFFMPKPHQDAVAAEAPLPSPPLLAMENFKVPLVRDGRINRYGILKLSLELVGEAERDQAARVEAHLRDAIIIDLQHNALNRASDDPSLDLALLRQRVRMVANRVLHGDLVRDVLVEQWLDPRQG